MKIDEANELMRQLYKQKLDHIETNLSSYKRRLKLMKTLIILHSILLFFSLLSLTFTGNMTHLITVGLWSVCIFLEVKTQKNIKKNEINDQKEKWEIMKVYDNETYVRRMREKKLSRIL